ncbi:unnamed protein product [Protopolystoma xenopodis]|uniref:Uncharacterized protein n=1 Tax=Protopolystoma xenopodis TaxID=117903 RepID=A0A448XT59_9PLAT|nr:unnamed protein product [Protopolystoma xenopodis]
MPASCSSYPSCFSDTLSCLSPEAKQPLVPSLPHSCLPPPPVPRVQTYGRVDENDPSNRYCPLTIGEAVREAHGTVFSRLTAFAAAAASYYPLAAAAMAVANVAATTANNHTTNPSAAIGLDGAIAPLQSRLQTRIPKPDILEELNGEIRYPPTRPRIRGPVVMSTRREQEEPVTVWTSSGLTSSMGGRQPRSSLNSIHLSGDPKVNRYPEIIYYYILHNFIHMICVHPIFFEVLKRTCS